MSTDGGVNLSRRAIRAARTDLIEALALLRPDTGDPKAAPVLVEGGPLQQLGTDRQALAGVWPAAMGFQSSTTAAITAVTSSYDNIVIQVENMIDLLTQALGNYDEAERAGEGAERTAQA
jgi:hypothetical protein